MFKEDITGAGQKVWVRIGRGEAAPKAPGIIVDARIGERTVPRSQAKGGPITLPETVIVVSFRHQAPQPGYYAERPEALVGLDPRTLDVPTIDGPPDVDQTRLLTALRARARKDLDARLGSQMTTKEEKDEAARYSEMPAFAVEA